ncbi:MAG TPA: Gfo/Idh/MocA family oxidoreductase [Chloroflexota bacterium]|jgi:predicted dehydrogenase|nr:Gfo/Idh/MocA family oxidoreductase [Chloroflexota bacterium]
MAEKSSFASQGDARATAEIPEVGIGMLGYAFMGKAHSNAFRKIPYIYWPPHAIPRLISIAGRSEEKVAQAARRYGYESYTTDWQDLVNDPRIQVFDNGGPNDLHAEPCIAAAQAGKHIVCEKPLGRTAEEARRMLDAVQQAGIKHMCAFNYRFVPAIALARALIQEGRLGRIYHFRARYLQEWIMDPNFPMVWRLESDTAGSGTLGDLGSHIIDLGRFLVGEPARISATTATFIKERTREDGSRASVNVDDAFEAVVEFENGAVGTLEATRFALGRKNHNAFEINGEKGSIAFNMERLNELEVYLPEEGKADTAGFRQVLVTESYHPFMDVWWPQGHIIGWEHTFIHELHHFLGAVVDDTDVAPVGATFEDGYRNAVICDAIVESARSGRRVDITY